jgi:xanthosine utilization system XapX-like protein
MLIYMALLAIAALAFYYIVANAESGAAYVTLSIVGAVGLLLGYQVWMHVRDLGSPLAEREGVVTRKWSRADLIIAWHSYYVTVGRTVFRLAPEDHIMVDEGMAVQVVHFPRTLSVVSIHELRSDPQPKP